MREQVERDERDHRDHHSEPAEMDEEAYTEMEAEGSGTAPLGRKVAG